LGEIVSNGDPLTSMLRHATATTTTLPSNILSVIGGVWGLGSGDTAEVAAEEEAGNY